MKFKKLVAEKRTFLGPQLIIAIIIALSILFWRALPSELLS